jgi:hypothetical protein
MSEPMWDIQLTAPRIMSTDMTLRDWFAGQFLTTVVIDGDNVSADLVAKNCYIFADAMMRERAK